MGLKESDQTTATVTLHRERSEMPPGSATLEICQSCRTYISHLLWILLYSHSVYTVQWVTPLQRVYTHQSLCLFLFLSSSTYVLFICKACFLLTAKLVFSFPVLVPPLTFGNANIFTNHDSLDVDVVSWCATLLWRCGETSFLPCWGSTWFPTLTHLSATCSPHPATMLTAVYG